MAIDVICPNCRNRFSAPDALVGKTRNCPSCSSPIAIDAPAPTPSQNGSDGGHESYDSAPLIPPREFVHIQDLVDMTAMVDIVFFLLIFFLVSSLCNLQASVPAPTREPTVGRTARAGSTVDLPTGEALAVTIDQDDIVSLNGDVVGSLQDLIIRLRNAKESSTAERLRIVGHPESTHGKAIMVMDAAASAGVKDVQLAVEQQVE